MRTGTAAPAETVAPAILETTQMERSQEIIPRLTQATARQATRQTVPPTAAPKERMVLAATPRAILPILPTEQIQIALTEQTPRGQANRRRTMKAEMRT